MRQPGVLVWIWDLVVGVCVRIRFFTSKTFSSLITIVRCEDGVKVFIAMAKGWKSKY